MVISFCDVCRQRPPGPLEPFQVGPRRFQVCGVCKSKPFEVPPALSVTLIIETAKGGQPTLEIFTKGTVP